MVYSIKGENYEELDCQDVRINYINYGPKQGTYDGEISFCEEKTDLIHQDSFTIRLTDERCRDYFELMKSDIKNTAVEFVENLLMEPSKEIK